MWINKNKFLFNQSTYKNKTDISSISFKEDLYVGTENGIVSCYQGSDKLYNSQYFTLKFDYLESCDVLEKITAFDFMESGGISKFSIVSNERNLKVFEVRNDKSTLENLDNVDNSNLKFTHKEIKEFSNVHSYMCNSVSLNNDNQYFISSDYLVVNLWRPDILEGCYTLIDIKPPKHTDLVYVINTCKFSKYLNTIFGYSTTNGEILFNDLRLSTKSDNIIKITNKDKDIKDGAFKSVSDFSFVDENLVINRSLNNVSLSDLRNPDKEVFRITISENIVSNPSILDSDAVYEKFKISENGKFAFTGSFSNKIYAINIQTGSKEEIELDTKYRSSDLNKTRFVASKNNGFYAVYGNTIYEYENDQ